MAEPTKKADGIEACLKAAFAFDRREHISAGVCVPPPIGCGQPATSFRDECSKREYQITGLCQKCQDEIFGV